MNSNSTTEPHKGRAEEEGMLEAELFRAGLILLAVGSGIGIVYFCWLRGLLPQFPCLFSHLFGLYCPGCGGTRAVVALIHGRLFQALWYHPLVPYGAIIGGGFMLTQGVERLGIRRIKGWKYHNWYLYGAIALIVVNFLIKNVLRVVWNITM